MNPFVKFMASTAGRITRVVAGLALIVWALLGLSGAAAIIVAINSSPGIQSGALIKSPVRILSIRVAWASTPGK